MSALLSSTLLTDRRLAVRPGAFARGGDRIFEQVRAAAVAITGRRSRREQRAPGEDLVRLLYEEHGRSLLAYALRLTGDRQAAEDVVQETLLRAWKHREDLTSGTGSVRGWLLTVARNIVTDRARARAVRPAEVNQPVDVPSEQRDPADLVADTVTVLGLLDRLSPDHRAVLVELYYRGHTVAETAEILRIAPGTVKSRTYYALRALRDAMAQPGEVRR